MFAVSDRQTAIDPSKRGFVADEFHANFQFSNLVCYPTSSEPIFRGLFTLEGKENQSLALVGLSGCGKSTVIGLLERWYDPLAGEANLGGKAIANYALLKGLRSRMALVGQEPIFFDLPIAENIAWGAEGPVTMKEIEDAAEQANAHTFIMSLPDKYNTRVGERAQLSGGQRQRIAIARALIRKPELLKARTRSLLHVTVVEHKELELLLPVTGSFVRQCRSVFNDSVVGVHVVKKSMSLAPVETVCNMREDL
ncbi:ATP-binding cassette, sub-B (MDR TAP), member 4 [Geranomyces variabilis]|nr:ATP-binding cassette, sub-B (MDR TAP), member 4 [Geranomyces variabilis]